MKLCGIFGYTDAGKTTFIENLCGKEVQKYKLEQKKGITLKVGYLEYTTEHNDRVYILDNPGHLSLSIETLRNIDLIDFGLYVMDASNDFSIDNEKNKLLLNHYSNMISIFKIFNIPFALILNKIDLCSLDNLKVLYQKIESRSNVEEIIPTSSLNKSVIDVVRSKLSGFINKISSSNKKKNHLGVGRVIKSFDVNPVGVELPQVTGGILGVYLYREFPIQEAPLYLSSRSSKSWTPFVAVNCRAPHSNPENTNQSHFKIVSIETESDPFWFKNDSKKSSFICTESEKSGYKLIENNFSVKLTKKLLNLNKGDKLLFIYEGQSFTATIRKHSRNIIECVKDNHELSVYKVSVECPILMFIQDDMKEYSFSGAGIFHEET